MKNILKNVKKVHDVTVMNPKLDTYFLQSRALHVTMEFI